ncbi:MAG TPA: hypothetical protein VK470_11700 [Bacteroidota bacterium]|nr:hypothetical protein [Bacteroidota bacterium]
MIYYVENLHVIFGIGQVLLFSLGAFFIARAGKTSDYAIIYISIAAEIVLNTLSGAEVLHWTGSVGDLRYLTVVGPFVALVSAFGMSAILELIRTEYVRTAVSLAVIALVVFNCTLTTQPRRWTNYEKTVIEITRSALQAHPESVLLSNNPIVQYVLDAAPTGGMKCRPLNKNTIANYSDCMILWDPYTANAIFSHTGLTSESILRDTTLAVLDRKSYWGSEFLLFYKHPNRITAMKE